MDVLKKVFNVFGIILCVIFSIPLICSLVVAPVLSGACDFVQTENLKKIVNEIDMEAIAMDSLGAGSAEEAEMMDILFKEGIMDEILDLYVEDVISALDKAPAAKKLTGDAVMAIFEKHMDTFVEMTKAQLDEATLQLVTDEDIADMLRESFKESAQGMADSMPSISELGITEEAVEVMTVLRDGLVSTVGIVTVVALAIVILLCQVPRFKSFMWLGVDFFIGGGLTLVIATSLQAIMKIAMASIPFGNEIMDPIVGTFAGAMKTGALIELGLAVLFIVIFIVGRVILKKKVAPQVA